MSDIYVLDESFDTIALLDKFTSFIWTERYIEPSDFELSIQPSMHNIDVLRRGRYLRRIESKTLMRIEHIELTTNDETGDEFLVSGRSVASLPSKRIIWSPVNVKGTAQDVVKMLLVNSLINPSDPKRKIDNIVFADNSDTRLASKTVTKDFQNRENVYEAILDICREVNVGFQSEWMPDTKQIKLYLWLGTDLSFDQTARSYVVFGEKFDNLTETHFVNDGKVYANHALVLGEGEEADRLKIEIGGDKTGYGRDEIMIDASSVKKDTADYNQVVTTMATEELRKASNPYTYECKLSQNNMFQYGKHFHIGDIVQVSNTYGLNFKALVTEFIRSENESGIEEYPAFEYIE